MRRDEILINTWVGDYFVVGRVKSNDRYLACIHKDDFADDIKNISKETYILKQYCTTCEILKDIDDCYLNNPQCKECVKEYNKNYNQTHAKENKERNQKNKERIQKSSRRYYQNNKERINKQTKVYYYTHADKRKKRWQIYYQDNKETMREYSIIYYNSPALFDTYSHQIDFCEDTRRAQDDPKLLEVKCTEHNCQKWFKPNNMITQMRISAINGKVNSIGTENHFYCSEDCKYKCPLYKLQVSQILMPSVKLYNRNEYNIWKEEVKRRNILDSNDNILHCEYCHCIDNLVIHHIQPQKIYPNMSLDPDNGLVCCHKCHMKYAHTGECSTGNLASLTCISKEKKS